MKRNTLTDAFAGTAIAIGLMLAAGGAGAQSSSPGTLGDSLASGKMSQRAFDQLIAGTGLSADQAKTLSVGDIADIKWKDD